MSELLTAGVVAEYNPFHNGHKYQLEQAKKQGAEAVVCVMSGDTVQRGDIAAFSKYERAKAALQNGADLVIELPCPYSCSNGEVFAKNAVRLLAGLGENVVNFISFGCETDDIEKLKKCADFSKAVSDNADVKKYHSMGFTYPQAVSLVSKGFLSADESEILNKPNNILAIEYIKACELYAPWIKPMPILRKGVSHDSEEVSDNFVSASKIREMILNNYDTGKFMPYEFKSNFADISRVSQTLVFKILTSSRKEISDLPDMNNNLENRFFEVIKSKPNNYFDIISGLKTRNITLARIRRMMIHLALGVRSEDIRQVPYGRILGLNDKGREILKKSKGRQLLKYDTSLKKLEKVSEYAKRVSFLEQNAVILRSLSAGEKIENEYTHKIGKN